MKALVCGGRDYTNKAVIFRELDTFHASRPITLIIEGDCRGADRLAGQWAVDKGIMTRAFPVLPEEWTKHGKAAGAMRNQRMLDRGCPEIVIAFPGGPGTRDMKRRALRRGLEVVELPA